MSGTRDTMLPLLRVFDFVHFGLPAIAQGLGTTLSVIGMGVRIFETVLLRFGFEVVFRVPERGNGG